MLYYHCKLLRQHQKQTAPVQNIISINVSGVASIEAMRQLTRFLGKKKINVINIIKVDNIIREIKTFVKVCNTNIFYIIN